MRRKLTNEIAALIPIAIGIIGILSGNPETGKTNLATGLGIKACEEGYKSR